MAALERRIGSAFFVVCGQYGEVQQFARERSVSRQWVYREAQQVSVTLEGRRTREEIERLKSEVAQLRQQVAGLREDLSRGVVLDDEKQTEFACVGQAIGVTLPQCHMLLQVLIAG